MKAQPFARGIANNEMDKVRCGTEVLFRDDGGTFWVTKTRSEIWGDSASHAVLVEGHHGPVDAKRIFVLVEQSAKEARKP